MQRVIAVLFLKRKYLVYREFKYYFRWKDNIKLIMSELADPCGNSSQDFLSLDCNGWLKKSKEQSLLNDFIYLFYLFIW